MLIITPAAINEFYNRKSCLIQKSVEVSSLILTEAGSGSHFIKSLSSLFQENERYNPLTGNISNTQLN